MTLNQESEVSLPPQCHWWDNTQGWEGAGGLLPQTPLSLQCLSCVSRDTGARYINGSHSTRCARFGVGIMLFWRLGGSITTGKRRAGLVLAQQCLRPLAISLPHRLAGFAHSLEVGR